jgi:3-hydroxyisobutyrate dehydrogenase-like beta-hydroxyacid dehydrogenase
MMDIGFIGLGAMGSGIVETLIHAGYRPRVWRPSDGLLPRLLTAAHGLVDDIAHAGRASSLRLTLSRR